MEEKETIEKLKILHQAFEKAGVPFHDEMVDAFLVKKRSKFVGDEFDEKTQSFCTHTHLIKPIKITVTPLQFENSGYGGNAEDNILDWFMYENSDSNPLVWNNVGKPSQEILASFLAVRQAKGPLRADLAGHVFNGEDGNHRLLTLILNQYIEMSAAKTVEQKRAVSKKYEMTLDCQLPFSKALVDALERANEIISPYNENSPIPRPAREYRDSMANSIYDKWIAEFNPETQQFSFELNGDKFVGTEEELIAHLKTQKQTDEPIMTWQKSGVFYLSCFNKIYKSKNKQKIDELLARLRTKLDKVDNNPYLEVKDLDSNTYELHHPQTQIQDRELAKEIAKFELEFIKKHKSRLTHKTSDNLAQFEADCKEISSINFNFILPKLEYKNLTEQELTQLRELFNEEFDTINQIYAEFKTGV